MPPSKKSGSIIPKSFRIPAMCVGAGVLAGVLVPNLFPNDYANELTDQMNGVAAGKPFDSEAFRIDTIDTPVTAGLARFALNSMLRTADTAPEQPDPEIAAAASCGLAAVNNLLSEKAIQAWIAAGKAAQVESPDAAQVDAHYVTAAAICTSSLVEADRATLRVPVVAS